MATNLCVICEERFSEWSAYASHKMSNTCYKKIAPTRTTSRSKAQIVADVENIGILKGRII